MSERDVLLRRARELLASSRLLLDHGDLASSVSRSYYAMFLSAEALLHTKALAPSSHRGLIAAFGEHFVKDGTFSREDGRLLADAHEQRVAADYDAALRIPLDQAAGLLASAHAFVDHVDRYLREHAS